MPEFGEAVLDGFQIQHFLEETLADDLILEAIWGDATSKEKGNHPPGSLAAEGHVYPVPSSTIVQRALFPPKYHSLENVPISTHKLKLVETEPSPRNVILKFQDGDGKDYWTQIQLFKHTSVQIYSKEEWQDAVCKVDKDCRGFKIGIAFEFKTHILALPTNDLLIQVHWASFRKDLPTQQANIYTDYPAFLAELVAWMRLRRASRSNRTSLAMTAIRKESSIFYGAGVYTTQEIFHKAGLSPNITEREVFDCPSQTARLVAAWYDLAADIYESLWSFMKPFLRGFKIACHRTDRLRYAECLSVYRKDRTNLSLRFKEQLNAFKVSNTVMQGSAKLCPRKHGAPAVPFDVFEPDHVKRALINENVGLGSLIFGNSLWEVLHDKAGLPMGCLTPQNSLIDYFHDPSFDRSTWLYPNGYSFLFNEAAGRQGMTAWANTLLYRIANTHIWSIIPAYSCNSCPDMPPSKSAVARRPSQSSKSKISVSDQESTSVSMIEGQEHLHLLMRYVTRHSEIMTVGPLDFCGTAEIIQGQGGKELVMVCKLDPRHTALSLKRQNLGAAVAKLKGKGLDHIGIRPKERKRLLSSLEVTDLADHQQKRPRV
ncbi:hypothetical protein B0H34DRAFT_692522 [Crassisporium funariophilum]|nr:hypothetical protein B0H34DRAFT_692522 [Crassisporium funariophilum]